MSTKLAKFDTQVKTIERAVVIAYQGDQDELHAILREEGWRTTVSGPLTIGRLAYPTKIRYVVERTLEEEL